MKTYRVLVTADAKADLKRYKAYLVDQKKNRQAARNVVLDFSQTKDELKKSAGSLADPESKKLLERGLKRINFRSHEYFLLYRIEGSRVFVTNMFHDLEDYESKLK